MGLGNYNNKHVIFAKVTKIEENSKTDARIQVGKKGEYAYYNFAEGKLIDIKVFEGEFEGQTTYRIKFILDAGDCEIHVEYGRYTAFTRDILNCLASLDEIQYVRITPFISEDKNTGKKYLRGSVRVGPEYQKDSNKLPKKYDYNQMPKVIMQKVGKKDVIDDTELIEWTDNLIVKIKTNINTTVSPTTHSDNEAIQSSDDDIPF